jgi:hypothetical protein
MILLDNSKVTIVAIMFVVGLKLGIRNWYFLLHSIYETEDMKPSK